MKKDNDPENRDSDLPFDPDSGNAPEDLIFRNEIEKLKLQAEFGAKMFGSSGDMPPEIEAEWLKNIRAFEEQYENVQTQKIRDIIGNPSIILPSEIDAANLESELDRLFDLMGEKGIVLDYDNEVPVTEIYRFVVEEMLDHETDVMDIPGFQTHLMYEEFHPNHAKDMLRRCDEFCVKLFEQEARYLGYDLDNEIIFADSSMLPRDAFIKKLQEWFDAYENFTVHQLLFAEPKFNQEQGMGHVDAFVDYDARLSDGTIVNFSGPGIFYLRYDELWSIFGMNIPGFTHQ